VRALVGRSPASPRNFLASDPRFGLHHLRRSFAPGAWRNPGESQRLGDAKPTFFPSLV